jgi:hypothetical protein
LKGQTHLLEGLVSEFEDIHDADEPAVGLHNGQVEVVADCGVGS